MNVPPRYLVIGGVLVPGAAAPKLVTKKYWAMEARLGIRRRGDQRRCGTRKGHSPMEPTYVVDGVVPLLRSQHAGRRRILTFALNNVTLPFAWPLPTRAGKKHLPTTCI